MNKYQCHMADPLKMEKDRSHITKIILNLTLEIIYMLTGEDYTIVKKTSGEHVTGEQNKTQTPTMKPPPSSSEKNNEQKILDLTNKIIELLTGEVPIRYQDVTVYFSMEEWKYLEGHKDLYRNIIKESAESLTSPDEADKRDLPEMCTSPQYFPSEDPSAPPEDSHSFCGLSHLDTSTLQKRDPTEARKTCKASFTPVSSRDCIGNGHTSVRNFQTAKSTSSDELKENNCLERVTERPPSCGPENLPITTIQIHRDYMPHFPSANIKEEPISSNEDSNLTAPRDHTRDPSPRIKEEPWEERNCTDICTATDHMQQYSSAHIELFVSYEEKPFMSNNIDLTTSPTEYVSSLSTNIKNEQQRKTSEKPYSCMECGKCFKLKSYLIAHQRRHTGEKPYSCLECGKSFSRMSNLANHKKVHTGEKPFSCSECGKSFARNSNLVVHQRVHTGEKPYPCLECGKCFFSNSYLVVHQRIHTGERPYSCSECLRRFISSSELLKHRKNHMRNDILKDSEYLL